MSSSPRQWRRALPSAAGSRVEGRSNAFLKSNGPSFASSYQPFVLAYSAMSAAAHEAVRVVRPDAADGEVVGNDGHRVVRDALGVPAAPAQDGQHPGLFPVGDGVGPAGGAIAVFLDEFAGDPHRVARRSRLLGDEPAEHPADAAVGVVFGRDARRAAVGGDEDAVLVDEAVGELLGRGLDPEEARRSAAGFARRYFAQVDDDVAPVVLVVGDHDRAVGAGLPADEDGEAFAVLGFDRRGNACRVPPGPRSAAASDRMRSEQASAARRGKTAGFREILMVWFNCHFLRPANFSMISPSPSRSNFRRSGKLSASSSTNGAWKTWVARPLASVSISAERRARCEPGSIPRGPD